MIVGLAVWAPGIGASVSRRGTPFSEPRAASGREATTAIASPGRVSPQRAATSTAASPEALALIAEELRRCTACSLYRHATQAVPGEGAPDAALFLIGEQPGDQEDVQGRPFVGPAGRVLAGVFEECGADPATFYITNAVKHFKWEARGNRRLHKKPNRAEVVACQRWLQEELEAVSPRVVLALGATAGAALLGPNFRVGAQRGLPLPLTFGRWSGTVIATIHPSAVLRGGSAEARAALRASLLADLRAALSCAAGGRPTT